MALVVTEPSVSGEHDLARILGLIAHFRIPAAVCVNKWDMAPDITKSIERRARELGAEIAGRISYDPEFSRLLCVGRTIAETNRPGGREIEEIAKKIHYEEIAI
jgi:MinD superfamily P-loop ATPase